MSGAEVGFVPDTLSCPRLSRTQPSQKGGGGAITLELDAAGDVASPAPCCEILALNDALDEPHGLTGANAR